VWDVRRVVVAGVGAGGRLVRRLALAVPTARNAARPKQRVRLNEQWAGRTLPASPCVRNGRLDGCYSHRLGTLGALADVELNPLVLFERPIAAPADLGVVNKHIFRVAVGSDESEAFIAVEPLHSSLCHTLSTFSF
jgi:hypothetical protein